jgi:hypothetical protein
MKVQSAQQKVRRDGQPKKISYFVAIDAGNLNMKITGISGGFSGWN